MTTGTGSIVQPQGQGTLSFGSGLALGGNTLALVAVPEPGTVSLAGAGCLLAAALIRRHRG
ncbi:MAG: PEP-CTERM sorting domain-containing protein [Planctomycetota bacterium]